MNPRPTIVCLCGSTRFRTAFEQANRDETLQGRIVLSVGVFGHHEPNAVSEVTKRELDELHLAKVDLADEILVVNVGGYIGESTRREIAYAESCGKPVRLLESALTARTGQPLAASL